MDMLVKFIVPALLFLLTLALGFWLSKTGRPYNGLLFNAHKLIAQAGVVVAAIQVAKILAPANSSALLIALLVVAAISIIALFASGALMSADKLNYFIMRTTHNIALGLMILALAVATYLLAQTP